MADQPGADGAERREARLARQDRGRRSASTGRSSPRTPNDANTLNRVGDLYARIQRIDEAVDFFNQIAAQYTKEGFFVKAIAIYKKIIKLNPTHLEVYERLAELYHKQGLINEARTQYQVLADYYQQARELDVLAIAIIGTRRWREVEPDNPTYHVKLAELYQSAAADRGRRWASTETSPS